jgi:predicted TIM-barrel fold metal-dependent hydrolase
MPYFAWRLSVSPMIDRRLPQRSQDEVFAGLRRFWYDHALAPGEVTFGALDHVADPSRVVFGTDYPFANPKVIAQAVTAHEARDLPADRRAAVDRGNALALFPRLA